MKVIELILKLEQFDPTADVRFEHVENLEGGGTRYVYGDIVSDVEHVPNQAANIITILPETVVRQRLHRELEEHSKSMDINKLQKLVLACKTKISDWLQ